MKSIMSEGGPFIVLNQVDLPLWSGIAGKTFVGDAYSCETDYEATGVQKDGTPNPPSYTAILEGGRSSGLLIIEPRETALISSRHGMVLLAQAIYANKDWSFSSLAEEPFQRLINTRPNIMHFTCASGRFEIFDAACSPKIETLDSIDFELSGGRHIIISDTFEPDATTGLILHCIMKE